MLLDPLAVRWKRTRLRLWRQPVEDEIDAAAKIHRRKRTPLEVAGLFGKYRLLVARDMQHRLALRSADELRNAEIERFRKLAEHRRRRNVSSLSRSDGRIVSAAWFPLTRGSMRDGGFTRTRPTGAIANRVSNIAQTLAGQTAYVGNAVNWRSGVHHGVLCR
jgi:hypothetical protein